MMDPEDRRLFERGVLAATASGTGRELDAALDELGWRDALAVDRRAAVSVVFELQGRSGAASTALSDVLESVLRRDGASGGLVVLPALGDLHTPGALAGEGRVSVRGLTLRAARDDESALVVMPGASSTVAVEVPVRELVLRPVGGLDPRLGLTQVEAPPGGARTAPGAAMPVDWDGALAAGRIAVAHQLVGVAGAMLQMAREHALGRVQFDRPIAAFQAVRHRLADAFVAVQTARAAVAGAEDDGSADAAAIAKAVAGRNALVVARHAQQVLAGMGFTAEHPFHGYLRRALVLDEMLGSSTALTRDLGAGLLRSGRLPDLLPL
jgi:hypothetical protein